MTAPASLSYQRLEAPLAPLERLPRGLWLWSLVHSQGRLVPRLAGIERWREALLEGRTAADAGWPPRPLAGDVAGTLDALGFRSRRPCCARCASTWT
ncbi:hypothetical protein [Ramlibacter lithotrophicus]|uniref:hypothetical protein n=1 Tax=Ramlibacter lithotrophicus TaxID=2606681 RepID=UPI00192E2378|nr:hypothetical protein [Ramlibacter lithotrophicus]